MTTIVIESCKKSNEININICKKRRKIKLFRFKMKKEREDKLKDFYFEKR